MMSVVDESMKNVQRRELKRLAIKLLLLIGAFTFFIPVALMGAGLYTLIAAPDVVTIFHPADITIHSRDQGWGMVWGAVGVLILAVPAMFVGTWIFLFDDER